MIPAPTIQPPYRASARSRMRLHRLALLAALMPALLATPIAHAAEHLVSITGNRYEPPELHIRAGDTVIWENHEKRTSHSVLFEATAEESARFFPGEQWSRRFDSAGEYPYRCGPHPEMTGRIIVTQ